MAQKNLINLNFCFSVKDKSAWLKINHIIAHRLPGPKKILRYLRRIKYLRQEDGMALRDCEHNGCGILAAGWTCGNILLQSEFLDPIISFSETGSSCINIY